jgi:ABC-type bacteriocin/lantibiotic exporter with double-glycine peptidase domain
LYLNNNDLFLGTVLENITLRNQETSPQEILELANKLGMEGFLNSFNRGFDTLIDPMGKKLTESTLKKIMMLRTFGGNRKLIILNEPFVGVDDYTKHQTLAYINSLKNTTLLLVSNDTEVKVACTHKLSLEKGMVSKLEKIN